MTSPAAGSGAITHGLLIRKEHLDKILAGTKIWEIRSRATLRRGAIALLESGSGHVVGTCKLTDVVGPVSLRKLRRNSRKAGFRPTRLRYATTFAWVLGAARRLPAPIPYRHPQGAVIWVELDPIVCRKLRAASRAQMDTPNK